MNDHAITITTSNRVRELIPVTVRSFAAPRPGLMRFVNPRFVDLNYSCTGML